MGDGQSEMKIDSVSRRNLNFTSGACKHGTRADKPLGASSVKPRRVDSAFQIADNP